MNMERSIDVPEPKKRRRRGPLLEVLFRLSKSPLAMFGLAIILLLIFCATFGTSSRPTIPPSRI